jgi:hypothetical protein
MKDEERCYDLIKSIERSQDEKKRLEAIEFCGHENCRLLKGAKNLKALFPAFSFREEHPCTRCNLDCHHKGESYQKILEDADFYFDYIANVWKHKCLKLKVTNHLFREGRNELERIKIAQKIVNDFVYNRKTAGARLHWQFRRDGY